MLFSSTNFGEQYFLFDDYYIPLSKYVKRKIFNNFISVISCVINKVYFLAF